MNSRSHSSGPLTPDPDHFVVPAARGEGSNETASGAREPTDEYRCPGQAYAISRTVHLGRLAQFYPACRQCPHRHDTATLAPRHVRRLNETQRRAEKRPLFCGEGAAGVHLNELGPAEARRLAAAFGVWLHRQRPDADDPPVVALAGDGRPLTPELLAAAAEGLAWAGCNVVDLGPASAACLAFAVAHLGTAGGVLVGNPLGEVHTVGLKFWAPGAAPLSAGGPLDAVREIYEGPLDRPTRRSGSLRRYQAEDGYLAALTGFYHALRPLRFLVDSTCPPVVGYVERLIGSVGCQMVPRRSRPDRTAEQIRQHGLHFGLIVDDDAERSCVLDERGRTVVPERLLVVLARYLSTAGGENGAPFHNLRPLTPGAFAGERGEGRGESALGRLVPLTPGPSPVRGEGSLATAPHRGRRVSAEARRRPSFTVVLEADTPKAVVRRFRALGGQVVTAGPRRAEVHQALWQHEALLAGGPSGRFWFRRESLISADALVTLTLLLVVLSQSDRPLSEVLDAQSPVE